MKERSVRHQNAPSGSTKRRGDKADIGNHAKETSDCAQDIMIGEPRREIVEHKPFTDNLVLLAEQQEPLPQILRFEPADADAEQFGYPGKKIGVCQMKLDQAQRPAILRRGRNLWRAEPQRVSAAGE